VISREACQDEATDSVGQILSSCLEAPLEIRFTRNRRTMFSWRRREKVLVIRLHEVFREAPREVVEAVALRISHGDRESMSTIQAFFDERRAGLARARQARAKATLRPRGRWHDLDEILSDLNERYLDQRFSGMITWGRRAGAGKRRTIRLGSYLIEDRLIRIHPSLDQAFVPRYFVEWVVFHEMLHQLVPMPVKGGRRQCHSSQFRAIESSFPQQERARTWEKMNIARLLES
jgi:predicted SprT family Zn-dependent metalloprotease